MAENPQAVAVAARMAQLGWNQTDLARRAGVDEGTIGDFLAHKRKPRRGTLGKIEVALDMTPGTLAGTGEMVLGVGRLDEATLGGLADEGASLAELSRLGTNLSQVSTRELLAELTARVVEMEREQRVEGSTSAPVSIEQRRRLREVPLPESAAADEGEIPDHPQNRED